MWMRNITKTQNMMQSYYMSDVRDKLHDLWIFHSGEASPLIKGLK